MAFLNFLLHEKSKIWNFSLSFQIYVPYDLKNQACNIYKYRTYNRNLRVLIVMIIATNEINSWLFILYLPNCLPHVKCQTGHSPSFFITLSILSIRSSLEIYESLEKRRHCCVLAAALINYSQRDGVDWEEPENDERKLPY